MAQGTRDASPSIVRSSACACVGARAMFRAYAMSRTLAWPVSTSRHPALAADYLDMRSERDCREGRNAHRKASTALTRPKPSEECAPSGTGSQIARVATQRDLQHLAQCFGGVASTKKRT